MKAFSITVNASPRYPIKETFQIEASNWATAVARAVREYFKKHKNMRSNDCYVSAHYILSKHKED